MTPEEAVRPLTDRFPLPEYAPAQLAALLAELAGNEHAPTTVREPGAAADMHLADSLVALELVWLRAAAVVADIGAGAGFPGLALAAALPATRFHEVESSARKCAFVRNAAELSGLQNVEVHPFRAEEWADGLGRCDAVTARALAPLPVLAEYAAPLLRVGGRLIAWKGEVDAAEKQAGAAAAAILGLESQEIRPVSPFKGARNRYLYVYLKVAETPSKYPRRAGMAIKRPLGANTQAQPAEISRS